MTKLKMALLILAIGAAARLIPHLPNATSILSLSLFAGWQFRRSHAIGLILAIMLLTDLVLMWMYAYPFVSSWTVFTYSGVVMVALFGKTLGNFNWPKLAGFGVSACLFYWLWTNLGVFLVGGLYPHTWDGLILCYIAALPFLGHSLLGNLIWLPITFGAWQYAERQLAVASTRG